MTRRKKAEYTPAEWAPIAAINLARSRKPERVISKRAYEALPETKERRKATQAALRDTPKGKAKIAAKAAYDASLRATPEGKAYRRKYFAAPARRRLTGERGGREKGFSPEVTAALLIASNGTCQWPSCGAQFKPGADCQHDHDHVTGAPRGMLCLTCNTALGKLGDNRDGLFNDHPYFKNPPAQNIFL